MSLEKIFMMDGYGLYVWSAYVITFVVFGIQLASAVLEKKRIKKRIKHLSQD